MINIGELEHDYNNRLIDLQVLYEGPELKNGYADERDLHVQELLYHLRQFPVDLRRQYIAMTETELKKLQGLEKLFSGMEDMKVH